VIHIDRIHVITDRPLGEPGARALGASFAHELQTALATVRPPAPRVRIGELTLRMDSFALHDRRALTQFAYSVAHRILDRTPE
jgi:hypothetical protein